MLRLFFILLFIFCDGIFGWLVFNYAKNEKYGKAVYTGILLFIGIVSEIYTYVMMFG